MGEIPDFATGNPTVETVVIDPSDPTIALGERVALTATPFDASGSAIETGAGIAQWESSNPAVAPVSSSGQLIGATLGTTTVTATFQDVSASVEVTVSEIAVASVEVAPARVVLTIGDTFEFLATPRDDSGDRIEMGLEAAFRVEDATIATVDAGVVTAVSAGTTSLIAEIDGVEGSAEIVVEDAVLDAISVDQNDQIVTPGDEVALSVSFTWQGAEPANLPTVSWSSSDAAVEVDTDGLVSVRSPGSATITATVGSSSDSVTFEVAGEFGQVAVGAAHTCARIRGSVYCWGDNAEGQLGHTESAFARVPGLPEVREVVAGRAHTCVRSSAGEVLCWGANDQGQLGNGGTAASTAKAVVPGTQNGRLYAHRDATCAGDVCWGDLVSSVETSPTAASQLSVGGSHRCEIAASTTCSGANDQGQLGINSVTPTGSGTPTGGYDFASLALGADFSCGVVAAGGMACWGDGDLGQIGDGGFNDSSVPLLTPLSAVPSQITAGDGHVCVRTASGDIYCWGANAQGQVGNGMTANVGQPTEVSNGGVFGEVRAEGDRTCALDSNGEVWCWGGGVNSPTIYLPVW